MDKLFTQFDPVTIIVVLLIAIPALVNFITWCKGLWNKREAFKEENIKKGQELEKSAEEEEHRFTDGEARMTQLESDVKTLKEIAEQQAKMIELLTLSDQLDIKCWIKMQHEKWIPKKCIDSQVLDLLEQRFQVYEKEGGNSWAKKLMTELRALPTVTIVPISDIHDNSKDR